MPLISVNWSDLEIAFERNSHRIRRVFSTSRTPTCSRSSTASRTPPRAQKVSAEPGALPARRPRVVAPSQYRWMPGLRRLGLRSAAARRLLIAIDHGKGAFRRFKDVLLAFPARRERWFAYRSELLHFRIQTWIDHMKIEVAAPPPWGHVRQPAEPIEVPRSLISSEAPGEILRRQARESPRRDPGGRVAVGIAVPRVPS